MQPSLSMVALALVVVVVAAPAAQANAGTPLMWASGLYLPFGNALIGLFEGVLLARLWKPTRGTRQARTPRRTPPPTIHWTTGHPLDGERQCDRARGGHGEHAARVVDRVQVRLHQRVRERR